MRKRGDKYELTVCDGYRSDGKQRRHYRTVEAKNDSEAKKLLIQFQAEVLSSASVQTDKLESMTLTNFFPYWKENYVKRKKLSNKHLERSTEIFNSRIDPAMGHCIMSEITPRMINRFLNDLQRPGIRRDGKPGGLSDRSVEMHFSLLRTLFNAAKKWRIVSENPCESVEKPQVRYDPKAVDVYEFDELAKFLQAMDDDPKVDVKYKLFAHLAIHTSCRRSELMGLEWKSVDLAAGTIDIVQASEYIVGKPIGTKSTKTRIEQSKPLSDEIISMFKQLKEKEAARRKKLGTKWIESGRVFTQHNGKPMHVNSYYTWLRKFASKHDLKSAGPQCLRHTSATHKLYLGVPAKDVQDDLGHTSIRTTNRYMHKLRSTSKESSNMMTKHLQSLRAKDQEEPNKD